MKFVLLIICLIFSTQSFGKVFNVSNINQYKDAFNEALNNGEDDKILLKNGIYYLDDNFNGGYGMSDNYDLEIIGENPELTIIDGKGIHGFLNISANNDSTEVTLRVANLTIRNTKDAIYLSMNSAKIIFENCKFINNITNKYMNVVYIHSSEFDAENIFINNVFINNSSNDSIPILLNSSAKNIKLINNTIVNNTSNGNADGISINSNMSNANINIYNNIFSFNGLNILALYNGHQTVNLFNNLWIEKPGVSKNSYYSISNTTGNTIHKSGNKTANPKFESTIDVHLQSGSPAINSGINLKDAFFPDKDFDGEKRIINGTVDIGADEYNGDKINFVSGFKTINYYFTVSPIFSVSAFASKPFAAGDITHGSLNLRVGMKAFSEPVDIYLGLSFEKFPNKIFLFDKSNKLNDISTGIVAWKKNYNKEINESIIGPVSLKLFPKELYGKYMLYLLAVPKGSTNMNKGYLWISSFEIGNIH